VIPITLIKGESQVVRLTTEPRIRGSTLSVFTIYPLTDARWNEFTSQHPRAGVFHSFNWLSALQRTYGYEPIAFTTCGPSEPLKNSLVFCKITSWITGRRLVSLPFSDHCDVLVDSVAEQEELLAHACDRVAANGYAYVEIRSVPTGRSSPMTAGKLQATETFCLHRLSLEVPLDTLFHNLHRNCIQRKIRRAEREGLVYESGRSGALILQFYGLLLRTRRRHRLPPQPLRWFRNLVESMGQNLIIRLVSQNHQPVAAMLTVSHKTTLTFKYGCSDERFHNLGGTPFLFWRAIQEAKNQGLHELDLGRSDLSDGGLVQFKDRLGAVKMMLPYHRYPSVKTPENANARWRLQIAQPILSWIPDFMFVALGKFLYRHIG
jgi:hypothetical protein